MKRRLLYQRAASMQRPQEHRALVPGPALMQPQEHPRALPICTLHRTPTRSRPLLPPNVPAGRPAATCHNQLPSVVGSLWPRHLLLTCEARSSTNGTALHRKHARETGRTCARRPNRRGGPNGAAAPTAPFAIRMATLAHRCTVQQWRLRPDAPQCRRRAHIAWLARRAGCTAALSALASPGSLAYVA